LPPTDRARPRTRRQCCAGSRRAQAERTPVAVTTDPDIIEEKEKTWNIPMHP
jgi:hypothetical protein